MSAQLGLDFEARTATRLRHGKVFECRPLTEAEALAHPWWGAECRACEAKPGRPCNDGRPQKIGPPDQCCRHRDEDGWPYCCMHGMRTGPASMGDYTDPRYST